MEDETKYFIGGFVVASLSVLAYKYVRSQQLTKKRVAKQQLQKSNLQKQLKAIQQAERKTIERIRKGEYDKKTAVDVVVDFRFEEIVALMEDK